MLRQNAAASGRIWLLLKHLDANRQGWMLVSQAREFLTQKESIWRVCGWRQLRNLLHQGEGIFWHRDKTRIWLRSVAKVADALDLERFSGYPVALSADVLLNSIGDVRAHFYASFHSGREKETKHGTISMPIARETLTRLSGTDRRTQRNYEERLGLKVQRNFAIGPKANKEEEQKQAWKHGNALFYFTDYKGKQGPKGTQYLAWQLPNNYFGPHTRQSHSQQRRLNRQLADLRMKRGAGNGRFQRLKRCYFGNALQILHWLSSDESKSDKHENNKSAGDLYWWNSCNWFHQRIYHFPMNISK